MSDDVYFGQILDFGQILRTQNTIVPPRYARRRGGTTFFEQNGQKSPHLMFCSKKGSVRSGSRRKSRPKLTCCVPGQGKSRVIFSTCSASFSARVLDGASSSATAGNTGAGCRVVPCRVDAWPAWDWS